MARIILLSAVSLLFSGAACADSPGFLLITTPRTSRISWVPLPEDNNYVGLSPMILIDSGLQHPQGIAIDQKRKRLYVADPDVQKIFSYQLVISGNRLSCNGEQTVVSDDAESRWVAVDGVGNVFFSDEPRNLILKVPAEKALRGDPAQVVVYNGNTISEVNEPGGVAVDNFHVYWTNKHFGTQAGSVVRGSETPLSPTSAETVSVLARNVVKSYGICLALGNIYYTDSSTFLYGVKKTGGPIARVSGELKYPRGCAWDGDGTVYVADRGQNAIYAFAGNMHTLGETRLTKAFQIEDAFGLAVAVNANAASRRHGLPPRSPLLLLGAIVAIIATALNA
mmetsp:Transcript_105906/g.297783  ORF Transcript_105906/g.297783 Transcript_105906/m.297783 type:complete len:338 (-) Transcript_105906:100-1113(-)